MNLNLYTIALPICKPFIWAAFRMKVYGRENIPKEGGVLLCSNHRSYLDPVVLAIGCKGRQIHYMAKSELFKGFFGRIIRGLGAFPVERGNVSSETMKTSYDTLESGNVMGMFPEGTRSKDGQLLKPKAGAAMISHKVGMPVLPVAICYEGKVRLFKPVTVRFGPLLTQEDLGMTTGTGSEVRNASRMIMEKIGEQLEKGR